MSEKLQPDGTNGDKKMTTADSRDFVDRVGHGRRDDDCKCGTRPYRADANAIEQKLKMVCETIKTEKSEAHADHAEMWKSINKKVTYYVFFSILGILFLIVVGLMAIVYHQGGKTQDIVVEMSKDLARAMQISSTNAQNVRENELEINRLKSQKGG